MRPRRYLVTYNQQRTTYTRAEMRGFLSELRRTFPGVSELHALYLDFLVERVGSRNLPDLNLSIRSI